MPLKPLREYAGASYPAMGKRLVQGLFVAAALGATTLGGCGPTIDSRSVDSAIDSGDLDGTVDCSEDADQADCQPPTER